MDTPAILIAIGSLLTVIGGGIGNFVFNWIKTKRDSQTKERKDTIEEYQVLLQRYIERIEELEADANNCRQTERKLERAEERITHLEDALERAGIQFRRWVPSSDTGRHERVTPSPTPSKE